MVNNKIRYHDFIIIHQMILHFTILLSIDTFKCLNDKMRVYVITTSAYSSAIYSIEIAIHKEPRWYLPLSQQLKDASFKSEAKCRCVTNTVSAKW